MSNEVAELSPPEGELPQLDAFNAHAYHLGSRINLRAFDEPAASHPTLLPVGNSGWCALFRYGAVVFFNVDEPGREAFLELLRPQIDNLYDAPETEEAEIVVRREGGCREDVEAQGRICICTLDIGRLQVIAEVLAKSVALAHHEEELAQAFDSVEPLARTMKQRGRPGRGSRHLLKHIGASLLIQHRMVGRVELTEKPELLWERPELERLYLRLEDEYELRERDRALERKLSLLSATAQTTLNVLQTARSLRLEWYIVFLIVIEVLLMLYELFFRHKA